MFKIRRVWPKACPSLYTGGGLDRLPEGTGIEPVVTTSNGQVKDFNVLGLDDIKGYRITFDWVPADDSVAPVELRMFIRTHDRTLSETWLYQHFPPAPDKRKYT
ncbi:hypothetical protein BLL42_08410 [Pseudomonas frederiksbergensis]|uniref:Glucan biosynthesis periplasmic MdoG C-terminal domain-containing protein n=1 Tax=Pseudomonas frederiksbergensis TaxID=104087 RepID=A0A1J0EIP8_9PSED|nr:hypothetical protein BLL42_08410 [Pseudomonas frederiksbergensis]